MKIQTDNSRVYRMTFASVYPMYIQKAEKKGRTKAEVDSIIFWLQATINKRCKSKSTTKVILKPFSRRHQN
jgi:hypothetical protein